MRHKWDGKTIGSVGGFKGGIAVGCTKCDCVKEMVGSKPIYFLNDSVYHKAPPCKPKSDNSYINQSIK